MARVPSGSSSSPRSWIRRRTLAQAAQLLLHLLHLGPEQIGDDNAQELAARDTRVPEDLPVLLRQQLDVVSHELQQSLRGLEIQLPDGPGQNPHTLLPNDLATVSQQVDEAPDEQRQPLGASVQCTGE